MARHSGPQAGSPAHTVMCYLVEKGGTAGKAALKELVRFNSRPEGNFREKVTQVLQNYEFIVVRETSFSATAAGKQYVARMGGAVPVQVAEKYVGQIAAPRVTPLNKPLNLAKHFPDPSSREGAFSFPRNSFIDGRKAHLAERWDRQLNLDDFGRVADAALLSIQSLLEDWFQNGVIEGNEFCIGSRSGETGKSMRIRLSGAKAGCWGDFAGEESGGDLISLYAYIEGVSQGKACARLAQQLGIALADDDSNRLNFKTKQKPAPAQARHGVEEKPTKPRTDWVPVLPVPADAGPYPVAHTVRGRPQEKWEYRDQERRLLGVIYRFVTSDGGKEILPSVFARNSVTGKSEWRWLSFPAPRPLYLPAPLRDGFHVLVVEGEKCADAAHALLGSVYDVVSWPGGGKAVAKADWSLLAARKVILWADADAKLYKPGHAREGQLMEEHEQPGMKAMLAVKEIIAGIGCSVRFVDIPEPGARQDGFDVADLIAIDGADVDQVLAWCENLRSVPIEYPPLTLMVDNAAAALDDGVPDLVTAPPDTSSSTTAPAGADHRSKKNLRSMMIATANGGIKGCRENVFMALQNDARLIGLVGLDKFSELQFKLRPTLWPSEPGEWTEGDDFHLGMYLANEYGLVMASVGEIEKAVAQAAREHAFNPVTDYLNKCKAKWDGVERVHDAFATYWGAADSAYVRLIARMFFVGLVARAFRPGCKHDCAPVFEGSQGEGKSLALAILGGDWFADTPFRMGEKDGYLSIQGIWIYEIAELEQFNRSEVTAVKAFMSSSKDRYREPYGRRTKNVPRRTVFSATTNEGQYFKDPTGNRRFWPIAAGRILLDSLREDRDQLFGEAVHMFEEKMLWYPTRNEQVNLINAQQDNREIPDQWIGRLYDYCEGLGDEGKPIYGNKLDTVTVRELLTKALHIEIGKIGPAKQEEMRISACMRKLGWAKKRHVTGAREYFYERPTEPEQAVEKKEEYETLPI